MNIKIKKLTSDLFLPTIEMIQRTIRTSQSSIYPPELIIKFCSKYDLDKFEVKAKEIEYFVAVDEKMKKVIGIIGLKDNELRTFFVDPNYQGQGVGKSLYNHLENVARDNGVTKLFLYGGPLGEPAYLKFGFKKIKTVDKEFEGIHFIDAYFEKELV
jgi:citrate lyase synthetase